VLALARASDVATRVGARVAVVALVCLVLVLIVGLPRLVPVPLLVLGGVYAEYLLVEDAPLDPAAPVIGAGLLVSAELAYWSLEERERVHAEAGGALRRGAFVAGLAAAGLVVAGAILALADVAGTRGLALDLLGAAAAAAVLLLVVRSERHAGP
jgi:hypothetical protein